MLPQSVFPYSPISLTTWVGDADSPFEGNLALGHRGALSLFGSSAPSCFPFQNLHWPWKTTSEILGAPESYLAGVVPKPVWSGALDLLRCGRDLVSTLDDQECLLKQDAEPRIFAHAPIQEILPREVIINKNATAFLQHDFRPTRKSPDLSPNSPRVGDRWPGQSEWLGTLSTIKNSAGLTILEVARAKNSISTPFPNPSESALKFTRYRLTSSPKITKRGHGIGRLVGPSLKRIGAEQSFEISSTEAQTAHFGVLCELDLMAPRAVWMGDVLNLPASRRVLAPTTHDQQYPPQHGAESTKSATAQPEEINLDKVSIINNATENLHCDCPSTKKSPDGLPCRFKFSDRWPGQSQWLGTLRATKNFAGLTILEVARTKNSVSTPFPNPSESALKFTRDRLTSSPKITKRGHGIGRLVDPSVKRIGAQQSFEIAPIWAAAVHFEVLGGLDTMTPETRLSQNLGTEPTPGSSHSGSSMPLSTRPSLLILSSTSPVKSRTTGHEPVPSTAPALPVSTAQRSLGWPDYAANHLPSQHPNEVRPAKFLAHATTLSAQSRAKIGRQARHQEP